MKAHPSWSYTPFRPPFKGADIYISRVEPLKNGVTFDWLGEVGKTYEIMLGEVTEEGTAFAPVGKTDQTTFTVNGLKDDTKYAFYVTCDGKTSLHRLFNTGVAVGKVVNYLHPEDEAYAFSGHCLCSPSMIRLENGNLLVSMDVFLGGAPQNLTIIFESTDDGESWHYVCELFPAFWTRLFVHHGVVYALACSTEYGDLEIGASYDGGHTFTAPVVLLRGSNGKKKNSGVHKNPQPVVLHNGRLYNTLEWGSWGEGYHAPMVCSIDENADLLDPMNWSFTEPVKYNPDWPGVAHGPSNGNIEGCLVEDRDGKLYNVMRYDMTQTEEKYGLIIRYLVDEKDPEAPLIFDRTIAFPANHSKFEIKWCDKTQKYYSVATRIACADDYKKRTLLSLMTSDDMVNWTVDRDIFDYRDADPDGQKIGFQYVDFTFEGDQIVFLCRTALNHAENFHNSNYITFHRIPLVNNA